MMREANDMINDLITNFGKAAPEITNALKLIGGKMQEGVKIIYEEARRTGKMKGTKKGILIGSLATLGVVWGSSTIKKKVQKKKQDKEKEKEEIVSQPSLYLTESNKSEETETDDENKNTIDKEEEQ